MCAPELSASLSPVNCHRHILKEKFRIKMVVSSWTISCALTLPAFWKASLQFFTLDNESGQAYLDTKEWHDTHCNKGLLVYIIIMQMYTYTSTHVISYDIYTHVCVRVKYTLYRKVSCSLAQKLAQWRKEKHEEALKKTVLDEDTAAQVPMLPRISKTTYLDYFHHQSYVYLCLPVYVLFLFFSLLTLPVLRSSRPPPRSPPRGRSAALCATSTGAQTPSRRPSTRCMFVTILLLGFRRYLG